MRLAEDIAVRIHVHDQSLKLFLDQRDRELGLLGLHEQKLPAVLKQKNVNRADPYGQRRRLAQAHGTLGVCSSHDVSVAVHREHEV